MLKKIAEYKFIDPQPLNVPIFKGSSCSYLIADPNLLRVGILEQTIRNIKTASKMAEKTVDGDSPDFDLEAEIKSHPDSLYVKCFAIKADETNDNGDHFQRNELKKATGTFIGVPIFTNHNNSDAEEARGKVVHAWWDETKNGIMIIARVDAVAYPKLAHGIKEEYIAGTSMGCQVQYSICSICHNRAENASDYCSHIRERKTRKLSERNIACNYHESGGEGPCPICNCKEGEKNKFNVDNEPAFEYNYGIKFIENSFVVNPACHDCGVTEIIDPQEFLKKVAAMQARLPRLLKAAASYNLVCTDQGCIKYAGQKEIDTLNDALELVTNVGHSMLKQHVQIDLEFLSDLMKVAADLQETIDELTQQGYGRLPSPPDDGDNSTPQQGQEQGQQGQQPDLQPLNPTPGGGSKIKTGPAGEAGTVTGPLANKRVTLKLGSFEKQNCDKIFHIRKILQKRAMLSLNLRIL